MRTSPGRPWRFCPCEGFRMPAHAEPRHSLKGPTFESLQGRNPRGAGHSPGGGRAISCYGDLGGAVTMAVAGRWHWEGCAARRTRGIQAFRCFRCRYRPRRLAILGLERAVFSAIGRALPWPACVRRRKRMALGVWTLAPFLMTCRSRSHLAAVLAGAGRSPRRSQG